MASGILATHPHPEIPKVLPQTLGAETRASRVLACCAIYKLFDYVIIVAMHKKPGVLTFS